MTPAMVSFHVMAEVFTMVTALGAVPIASAIFPVIPVPAAFSKLGFCCGYSLSHLLSDTISYEVMLPLYLKL